MEQTWNSKTYAQNARFVSDLGMPVLEWLHPKAGERILDLGCGDGALTLKLQELGCEVVSIDSSPDFIDSAKSLGLDARLLDHDWQPEDLASTKFFSFLVRLHCLPRFEDGFQRLQFLLRQ